ncbi:MULTISPECIES: SDR family NAD(P)-dependent oxidoreductase [Antrihabitans]|uniref:SDR family NAD(P)-dependent oxidoreductase n=2 Tax=Antrihabitans TaxID=2799491 RepID=A0A934NN24_9NOCA|nr:SDR family NAD(P)-dependent oxidoreductase [Antrihabitans stalagmiti]MBJ8338209.1 SDR family NAD(P)-dependent oxidoreductase [Antrihabitans stalagmiti]
MTSVSIERLSIAITGGARGIGREIAAAFAARGAHVAIGDIDADAVAATAAELGRGVVAFPLDVTDAAGFAKFLDEAAATFGTVDVLVNNAGIMPIGSFVDEADSLTTRTVDIDIRGVLTGTKLAGRTFVERGSGHVVNIASIMGTMASPNAATYCAAKFAVVGLGQALRQEWRGTGAHITTICPGFVRTELISGMTANAVMQKVGMVDPQAVADAVIDAVASGRSGETFVPKPVGFISKGTAPLPAGLRDALFRLSGGEKVTQTIDKSARQAYQQRAAGDSEGISR